MNPSDADPPVTDPVPPDAAEAAPKKRRAPRKKVLATDAAAEGSMSADAAAPVDAPSDAPA